MTIRSVGRGMTIPGDPSMQLRITLSPKVCKYHLDWASGVPRDIAGNIYGREDCFLLELGGKQDVGIRCRSWDLSAPPN